MQIHFFVVDNSFLCQLCLNSNINQCIIIYYKLLFVADNRHNFRVWNRLAMPADRAWARLVNINDITDVVNISSDKFTIGRLPGNCFYVLWCFYLCL